MGFKELNLDSIVTGVESEVIKSLRVKVVYADRTAKQSQFALGDNIAVKIVANGKLLLLTGDVAKINTETNPYFVLDISKTYKSYNEKIYPEQVRDISNLTAPSFDTVFDADGNVVVPPTTPTTGGDTNTGGGTPTTGGDTTPTTGDGTTGGQTPTDNTTPTTGDGTTPTGDASGGTSDSTGGTVTGGTSDSTGGTVTP